MKLTIYISLILTFCFSLRAEAAENTTMQEQRDAALGVIERFMGSNAGQLDVNVVLDLDKTDKDCDRYSYALTGKALDIHASSAVAACRAFYDFVKSNGAGICSWTGNRFEMPADISTPSKSVASPYRDHQYLNVVTYGYSMPYWDADRWDRELDWMALHGIDMPLMLLASEAIYRRVFKEKGVTDAQLDEWEVGPAHLPWMRMGNLSGNSFDGPLGQPWHDSQIALAHHVLSRMKELGMNPVVPAFGGFVPKAYAQKLGNGKYVATGWNWVPQSYRNYRITPAVAEFKEIGRRFIELWDKEFEPSFGEFRYYLSDSFNEMDVPDDLATLSTYGKNIYDAIIEGSGNPEAVWVTQGWEFVYGRGKWSSEKYKALRKDCAPHQFMSLYMAPEYGGYQWDYYSNFHGDDWNYTMLPNMGGKNFWTGRLQSYTQDYPRNLASGGAYSNCTGWGMTMEGIEYNELLYELISDMGWTSPTQGPGVEAWMNGYGRARFGEAFDGSFQSLYTTLHNTVYSSYIDHQNFAWQGNGRSSGYYETGNINTTTDAFFQGFDRFFSEENMSRLKDTGMLPSTLRADIIEFAAFYAAASVPKVCKRIISANNCGKKDEAREMLAQLRKLMHNMDYLLTGHPIYDEAKWEDRARRLAAGDEALAQKYVKNARRIVTTWYGSHSGHEAVNDYASRIYAGLIRDYYMPRLIAELSAILDSGQADLRAVELKFIPNGDNSSMAPALSTPGHFFADSNNITLVKDGVTTENTSDAELLDLAKSLVDLAREESAFVVSKDPFLPSNDEENHWYYIHSNNPDKLDYVLTATGDQTRPTGGFAAQPLTGRAEQMWRFIKVGTDTYRMENRYGQNFAFDNETMKTYLPNLNTELVLRKDEANGRFALIPSSKKSTTHNSLHLNSSNVFTLWQATENGSYLDASTWTMEATDASAVPEDTDFSRFVRRLSGFQTSRHGQESFYGLKGQPLDAEALSRAISRIDHRIDALTTYSEYLGIYRQAITDNFNMEGITGNQEATNLFELILSAFQLDPAMNSSASANEAFHSALIQAQQTLANGKTSTQMKSAQTKLKTAIKAYIDSSSSFPFTSPEPTAEGRFDAASKVITMKFGNASFITLDNIQDGYLRVSGSAAPSSNNHAYWIVCGNDLDGYRFYSLAKGPAKVLGMTGTEAEARMALYDASDVPAEAVTRFLYTTNSNGQTVFYYNSGSERRAWNNRGGWFALWNGAGAFQSDQGSAIICTQVAGIDASRVVFEQDGQDDSCGLDEGSWTPTSWKTATSAQSTSNFYEAASLDIPGISVSARGNVLVTVKYTSGNHRQVLYGAELIDARGNVAYHDYHMGSAGGLHTDNVYTMEGVAPGNYTARCWTGSRSDNDYIDCSGSITVSGAASKTLSYNKQTWVVDNSLLTNELKSAYTRVGTNNYKYLDVRNVSVPAPCQLDITYSYTSGSERLDIIGVELLDGKTGQLIETPGTFDGHYGYTGTNSSANTYSIQLPEGNFSLRTWAMYTRPITSSGTIAYNMHDDETSIGINVVSAPSKGRLYNLQGLPVAAPRKGEIVIGGGRKTVR